MQRKKFGDIEWLEFDLLSEFPKVRHAFFLRHGGCSHPPYGSLNTGFFLGDQDENVKGNIDRIKFVLQNDNPTWRHLVSARGVHGKAIATVIAGSPEMIPNVDGLMTKECGVSLMIKNADCQAALFYDPKNHAIANIHAGWRGSVANIYSEAIQQMQQAFGSHPSDLLVCITPSLGPDEAEFIHYRSELPEEFWYFQPKATYFDFWSISEHQLHSAGILPHHIEIARLSTYANACDFYSHRRDKTTGRHATCITLL